MSNGNLHGPLGEQIHLWDAIRGLFLAKSTQIQPRRRRWEGVALTVQSSAAQTHSDGLQTASLAQPVHLFRPEGEFFFD